MRLHLLLAVCALGLCAESVSAQPRVGPTNSRPPVSPYLNLLRPGNSAGANYYNLVRPQLDFRNSIQNLQQEITNNQTAITDLNTSMLPATGHATTFLDTRGYFPSAPGARPGGAAPRPQPSTGRR